MSIGRRLTGAALVLAVVGSSAYAAVFNITAHAPNGTQIAASDLKIREVYVGSDGSSVDTTTNPSMYPINRSISASMTNPAVTFTITQKSTGKSVTIILHGNKPPSGTVLLNPIIP